MAYGDYYPPSRSAVRRPPLMGDLVDPRDPRLTGGVTQAPTPRDQWGRVQGDPDYGKPPAGQTDDYNFGGDAEGNHMPPPGTPQTMAKRSYQGGALAYYGVGNIEGTEDIFRRRGNAGTLTGFNTGGWGTGERGTMSIKNVNGAIFSRYAAKPSSIDLVLADPDFQALFPNAKKVGFDKIDYGDGVAIDVLTKADPEKDIAEAWAWQPDNENVPTGAGKGAADDLASGKITTLPIGVRAPMSTDAYRSVADRDYRGPSFRDLVEPDPRER